MSGSEFIRGIGRALPPSACNASGARATNPRIHLRAEGNPASVHRQPEDGRSRLGHIFRALLGDPRSEHVRWCDEVEGRG